MVAVNSTMLPLGTEAPPFSLPDPSGQMWGSHDDRGAPALLVVFICNHCPYVKHLADELARHCRGYQDLGVVVMAVNSNDFDTYPDDRPEAMAAEASARGYTFPYLIDEDQSVARAYTAACTPDFFLFDRHRRLVYRGEFDDSRPGNGRPVTGNDLDAAVDAVMAGRAIPEPQHPSIGCNIKWKPGNEPPYFG